MEKNMTEAQENNEELEQPTEVAADDAGEEVEPDDGQDDDEFENVLDDVVDEQEQPTEADGQEDLIEESNETDERLEDTDNSDETIDEEIEVTVGSVIEAVLFASDEPLTGDRLGKIAETGTKQVRQCVETLNQKYKDNGSAFRIETIAGGYQMLTLSPYNHWLKKLLRARSDSKLTPAALETLAIIAYKQPIIRADVEVIRGVAAGEMIRSLMYKRLVKIIGRAEILGRPMLYGTTKKFLETFGLNSLKDLPKIEELKKPKG